MAKGLLKGLMTGVMLYGVCLVAGENLVKYNSSFEVGLNDWEERCVNYNIKKPGYWDYIPIETDSTTAAVGKSSVHIRNPRGDKKAIMYLYLHLKPGVKYTFSFYGKTDTPGAKVKMIYQIRALPGVTIGKNLNFTLTNEWKRYSGTMQFDKVPDSLANFQIGSALNSPANNIWIDGIQVEEGDLTDFKTGSPYEFNVLLNNDRGNCYYEGEKQNAEIKVYSSAIANEQLEAKYVIKDFADKTVKKGSVPVVVTDNYGKASIPFNIQLKGIFKVYWTLCKGKDKVAIFEDRFAIIKPNNPKDFDDDSFWGHHVRVEPDGGTLVNPVSRRIKKHLAMAKDAGVRWHRGIRTGSWEGVEPKPGKYIFIDKLVDELLDNKIRIMGILGHRIASVPPHARSKRKLIKAHSTTPDLYMPDMKKWADFVYKVVSHYKGKVDCWEIFNEPNVWIVPEEYLELCKVAYEAAKKANPDCIIVGPCSTGDFNLNAKGFVQKFLQLGGAKYVDVISVHLYVNFRKKLSPEAYALPSSKMIEGIEKCVKKYAPGKPIWNSEMCWYYADDDFNKEKKNGKSLYRTKFGRAKLDKGLNSYLATGNRLQNHVVYLASSIAKYFDHTTASMCSWSSFEQNNLTAAPTALLPMYCNMTQMLNKVTFLRQVKYGDKIRCYSFKKPEKNSFVSVIWTIDESEGKIIPSVKNPHITYYDMMGNKLSGKEFEISNNPVYVEGNGLSKTDYFKYLTDGIYIAGMKSFEIKSVLADSEKKPCWQVNIKSLFLKPVEGGVIVAKVPKGIKVIGGKKTVPFKTSSGGKSIVAVNIPIEISGNTGGEVITWVKVDDQLKSISERINIITGTCCDKPITIDGNLNSDEWPAGTAVAIDRKEQVAGGDINKWKSSSDLSAKVYTRWNDDTLFLGVKVVDDKPKVAEKDSALWHGSSVECFFNTATKYDVFKTNYTNKCCQLIFAPALDDKPCRLKVLGLVKNRKFDRDKIKFASQKTLEGYNMEIAIPIKVLGVEKLYAGKVIRFNFAINDAEIEKNEAKRKNQMIWNGKSNLWKNKTQMEFLLCK